MSRLTSEEARDLRTDAGRCAAAAVDSLRDLLCGIEFGPSFNETLMQSDQHVDLGGLRLLVRAR